MLRCCLCLFFFHACLLCARVSAVQSLPDANSDLRCFIQFVRFKRLKCASFFKKNIANQYKIVPFSYFHCIKPLSLSLPSSSTEYRKKAWASQSIEFQTVWFFLIPFSPLDPSSPGNPLGPGTPSNPRSPGNPTNINYLTKHTHKIRNSSLVNNWETLNEWKKLQHLHAFCHQQN